MSDCESCTFLSDFLEMCNDCCECEKRVDSIIFKQTTAEDHFFVYAICDWQICQNDVHYKKASGIIWKKVWWAWMQSLHCAIEMNAVICVCVFLKVIIDSEKNETIYKCWKCIYSFHMSTFVGRIMLEYCHLHLFFLNFGFQGFALCWPQIRL